MQMGLGYSGRRGYAWPPCMCTRLWHCRGYARNVFSTLQERPVVKCRLSSSSSLPLHPPFCHCDISLDFEQSLLLPCVTSWMCLGETSTPHSAPHSVYGKPMMLLGQTSVPHSATHSVYGKPIMFLGQAFVPHSAPHSVYGKPILFLGQTSVPHHILYTGGL